MNDVFTARTLLAEGLALHLRERSGAGPAVLFLHGWLDHSHSFDGVCAHLPESWRLLLLDFRGQGRSAHLPPGAQYAFSDYLLDVEAVLDGLGLAEVHLVGHSMGAIVAMIYAAVRPERVQTLTMIEAIGPHGREPAALVPQLAGFLDDAKRAPHRHVYASVEEAAARLRLSNPDLPEPAALHLARHGTEPFENGLAFTFDPRLRRRSGTATDEAQVLALLGAVRCPRRLLLASHGLQMDPQLTRARIETLAELDGPHVIEGGHHVHMERPAEVAEWVRGWVER